MVGKVRVAKAIGIYILYIRKISFILSKKKMIDQKID
jgi:hypothetical protein